MFKIRFKNISYTVVFCFLLISGSAQHKNSESTLLPHLVITQKDMQGTWLCVETIAGLEVPRDTAMNSISVVSDDALRMNNTKVNPFFTTAEHEIIYFRNDTMYTFSYPCEMYSGEKYRLSEDSMYVMTSVSVELKYKVFFLQDTLFMKSSPYAASFKYVRSTADAVTIQTLIRDTVNVDCLLGKWNLVYEEGQGDIAETWKGYPFVPPDVLKLERKNFVQSGNNGELVVRMRGRKRHFRYEVVTGGSGRKLRLELARPKGKNGRSYFIGYEKYL